jgi:hypothetical protein
MFAKRSRLVNSFAARKRQAGQTIIVAMIIMGVLLILGLVYIGIIDRNIVTTGRMQQRSVANDLMEAGIRYAHAQLLQSELGADWRGTPTAILPVSGNPNATADPDILYLRPGTGFRFKNGLAQIDNGGPDGLGPYFRVNYSYGRSLVRVRYAPSDINIFNPNPSGALRNPGLLRNYIIIESVGRPGAVNQADPTTLASTQPIQFSGYSGVNQYDDALAKMEATERTFSQRAIDRAFVSIGIIESARYVTNKYNVSRAVELGIPDTLAAMYEGLHVATGDGDAPLTMQLGNSMPLYTLGKTPTLTSQSYPGNGSAYVNGDVTLYGNVILNVNKWLGDKFVTSGIIKSANANSQLILNMTQPAGPNWTTTSATVAGSLMDSRNPAFSSQSGILLDGVSSLDVSGYSRGAGRKEPPSILARNPDSNENRYLLLSKDSGAQVNGVNVGNYGYGQGVYVNNPSDIQMPEDEAGRQASGAATSLVNDWLNPNNGQTGSGWRGFYYVPPGAYVQLTSDGFVIVRNGGGAAQERTWKNPDGTDTGSSLIRYRLGLGADGMVHIVNTYTPGVSINRNLGTTDYQKGPTFNGVVYFDGNVRVRGIIPTDVQMTIVSNATIYVEGSIIKGVLGNGLQSGTPVGERLQRPSHSMLMLMAKDYVTLNTTQFVGPTATQPIEPVNDVPGVPGYNPIRMRTGGELNLQSEFAPDNEADPNIPSINPLNPSTWPPYPAVYYPFKRPGTRITTNLVLAHTMDDGPAAATFLGMNVNFGAFDTANPPESTYYFPVTSNNLISSVYTPPPAPATYQIYGLGGEPFQRYGKFESTLFPLVDPTTANFSDLRMIVANNANGVYRMFSEGFNDFLIRQTNYGGIPTNDYLVGRTALIPHDIRIEASMYAEEGSFFVIPGQWLNPNPNDTREAYGELTGNKATKDFKRMEAFGSAPGFPFYGEPADVRISIIGSVSENMPPSMDVQSQWTEKWGWIPRDLGASGVTIPDQHVPRNSTYRGATAMNWLWVPNLTISYDPVLATARPAGFNNDPTANPLIRMDAYGRALPPLPRLPVSPVLAYFGEVR